MFHVCKHKTTCAKAYLDVCSQRKDELKRVERETKNCEWYVSPDLPLFLFFLFFLFFPFWMHVSSPRETHGFMKYPNKYLWSKEKEDLSFSNYFRRRKLCIEKKG